MALMAQMAQMAHEAAKQRICKSANQRISELAFALKEEHPIRKLPNSGDFDTLAERTYSRFTFRVRTVQFRHNQHLPGSR